MDHIEVTLVLLLVAVALLAAAARAINVPYPIVLVIGGAVLGFFGLPDVELDPDLVLLIFLPPLLYAAAFFANLRDLRADLRVISLQAIGLVLATMVVVAVVAHELVDGVSWPVAFTLGAIVGPTDPVAATAIARRLGVPRRQIAILEGEGLINDATALVAYQIGIKATVGVAAFSLMDAGLEFVVDAAGGIAIGLAVGYVIAEIRQRLERSADREHDRAVDGLRGLRPRRAGGRLRGARRGHRRLLPRLARAEDRRAVDPADGLRHVGAAAVPAQRAAVRADRPAAAVDPRHARRDLLDVHAPRLRRGGQRRGRAHAARVGPLARLRDPSARPAREPARRGVRTGAFAP